MTNNQKAGLLAAGLGIELKKIHGLKTANGIPLTFNPFGKATFIGSAIMTSLILDAVVGLGWTVLQDIEPGNPYNATLYKSPFPGKKRLFKADAESPLLALAEAALKMLEGRGKEP